jgi:hypothetical protein
MPENFNTKENVLQEPSPACLVDPHSCVDVDISLLQDSLAKTPWERMLANDDALNFAESLRGAMEMRNAKP